MFILMVDYTDLQTSNLKKQKDLLKQKFHLNFPVVMQHTERLLLIIYKDYILFWGFLLLFLAVQGSVKSNN